MTARTDAVVDQLVFRWDPGNRSGSTGFGLVAWSGEERRAQAVYQRVGTKLQMPGEMLRPGLVRVRGRDEVVLIRRSPGRDPGGRPGTVCHVLRGPAQTLDVATCLGLHAWDWEGSQVDVHHVRGSLPRVPVAALLAASEAGQAALRSDLRQVDRSLCAAVAAVLRNPGKRYSVLDPEGRDACPVLWGLYQIFDRLLEPHPLEWSFATYDTDDSKGLRFVFLPRWPTTPSHDEQRIRVRGHNDPAAEVAEQLVAWHLEGVSWGGDREWEVAQALQVAHGGRAPSEAEDRLLQAAQHAIAAHRRRGPRREPPAHRYLPESSYATSHVDEAASPVTRREDPVHPDPLRPESLRPESLRPESQSWEALRGAPPPGEISREGPGGAAPRDPSDDELLRRLHDDRLSHSETERLLGEIHGRFDDWQDSARKQLCAIVLDRGLFLAAEKPGWTADERAHDVASLYTWAVRPFAKEPWAVTRLKSLLPRLWHSKDDAARAAVWEILQGGPHLSEDVWLAVCRAMSHVAAAVPKPAVLEPPVSKPPVPEPAAPEPPVGEPGPAAQSILSRLFYGDGMVAAAAPVVILIVVVILMALWLIRACDGRGVPPPQQDEKCQDRACQETKEPSPPEGDSQQPEDAQQQEAQESEDSQESNDPQQPENSQPGTSPPQDSEESASQGSSTTDGRAGAGAGS